MSEDPVRPLRQRRHLRLRLYHRRPGRRNDVLRQSRRLTGSDVGEGVKVVPAFEGRLALQPVIFTPGRIVCVDVCLLPLLHA